MKRKNPIIYSLLEHRYFMNNEFDLLFEDKKWWESAFDWVQDYAKEVGEGGAEVIDMAREAGEGIAADPVEFAKQYFRDLFTDPEIYHSASALASTVPLYGDVFSLVDAALYAAQGDPEGAKLALTATIPLVGSGADVTRVRKALNQLEEISIQAAKQGQGKNYLRTTSLPGAKKIEVPPRYSPERPATIQRDRSAELIPEPIAPKSKPDYTPWVPKPAEPSIPTPKPVKPPVPGPKPYFPPALPEAEPIETLPEAEPMEMEAQPVSYTGIQLPQISPAAATSLASALSLMTQPQYSTVIMPSIKTATKTANPKEEEEDEYENYDVPEEEIDMSVKSSNMEMPGSSEKADVDLRQTKLGKYSGSYRLK